VKAQNEAGVDDVGGKFFMHRVSSWFELFACQGSSSSIWHLCCYKENIYWVKSCAKNQSRNGNGERDPNKKF
jgi:hypothetical protein